MNEITVLLADDHLTTREGLRALVGNMPGWAVCGEATTGREAVALTARLHPAIVVMDLTMPGLNGLDATRQIKLEHPATEVLMFTGHEEKSLIRQVFAVGARSYLLKTSGCWEVERALRALAEHKSYFTNEVAEILLARLLEREELARPESGTEDLTPREREVVQLLAEGSANVDVASQLKITVRRAAAHRSAIMKKLRLKAFSELVRWAIRHHLISA
jgi:DNA-binding NarL/FixJ family response regulator